jgi:TrmH family RNA methyltransferase
MAETVTPQGVLGRRAAARRPAGDGAGGRAALVAVLEAVADPGNAGTVLRTADAAGRRRRRAHRRARSTRTTASACAPPPGSLWHLPGRRPGPLEPTRQALRRAGLQRAGHHRRGGARPRRPADAGALAGPTAWLLGQRGRRA